MNPEPIIAIVPVDRLIVINVQPDHGTKFLQICARYSAVERARLITVESAKLINMMQHVEIKVRDESMQYMSDEDKIKVLRSIASKLVAKRNDLYAKSTAHA